MKYLPLYSVPESPRAVAAAKDYERERAGQPDRPSMVVGDAGHDQSQGRRDFLGSTLRRRVPGPRC